MCTDARQQKLHNQQAPDDYIPDLDTYTDCYSLLTIQ